MLHQADLISRIQIGEKAYAYYPLHSIPGHQKDRFLQLPYSIRIMIEACYRRSLQSMSDPAAAMELLNWAPQSGSHKVIPFYPSRVLLQDFTGVPVLVDLAAMREAAVRAGKDPAAINPVVPVDLVIDHSVQVDDTSVDGFQINAGLEFERNRERYEFLHWTEKAFTNIRIVPPATGIVHQVNLEYLSNVLLTKDFAGETFVFPEIIVGTDSHTTMINGLGVLGWGVGGIEAIAAMLGQPLEIVTPDVIGFRLTGKLKAGVTPTDLTLTITELLRKKGVVEKFVEFFGPGLASLSLADRAMIANMTPENGGTVSYFPVDSQTIDYLRLTGRNAETIQLIEKYFHEQGLFRTDTDPDPIYSDTIELDLGVVESSLAGPKRPQDRVRLREMKKSFARSLAAPRAERGYEVEQGLLSKAVSIDIDGQTCELRNGSVIIAAITSCTNTSNPYVMIAAGLLARNAVLKGLTVNPLVKTSLAPGSRVVVEYLAKAGLLLPLGKLGFNLVGFGCTSCIGNSGPIRKEIAEAIQAEKLVTAAVLSGNRNFEGRVHPQAQANYLASPPLVVAFALAGRVDINLVDDPIGHLPDGKPVFLEELWPTSQDIEKCIRDYLKPELFSKNYATVFQGNPTWNAIKGQDALLYKWQQDSTYIQEPPFLLDSALLAGRPDTFTGVRVLAMLGDSITTDHISPAGNIAAKTPAGQYLLSHGVANDEFNSYGARRGNDRVMTRGTFANIRLKNLLLPGMEGGFTEYIPSGEQMTIFDAARKYQEEGTALMVIAGKEYGTGSSRDWAAKGPLLLGVMVILAESFERIHRSNLVGMGILPLQFKAGENAATLGLTGREVFTIQNFTDGMQPDAELIVIAARADGEQVKFTAIARIDTPIEVNYYLSGGLLPTILREMTT
jgi:aconitate hydratase